MSQEEGLAIAFVLCSVGNHCVKGRNTRVIPWWHIYDLTLTESPAAAARKVRNRTRMCLLLRFQNLRQNLTPACSKILSTREELYNFLLPLSTNTEDGDLQHSFLCSRRHGDMDLKSLTETIITVI